MVVSADGNAPCMLVLPIALHACFATDEDPLQVFLCWTSRTTGLLEFHGSSPRRIVSVHSHLLRLRGGADVAVGEGGWATRGKWELGCPQGTTCTDFLCPLPHVFAGDAPNLGVDVGDGAEIKGALCAGSDAHKNVEELTATEIAQMVREYGGSELVCASARIHALHAHTHGAQ